jgi:hypothetical protein
MSSRSSHGIHIATALVLASALTAAPFFAITRASRDGGTTGSGVGAWRYDQFAVAQMSPCQWGATTGLGQAACSAWGVPAFPGSGTKAVAQWQPPVVFPRVVPQITWVPADKQTWVRAAMLGSAHPLLGPH